jgi:tetratricopeptide (TPR) repeat protein
MLHFATGGSDSMRTSKPINAFWDVARESSADGERLRRRLGAVAAMTLVVNGFLLAIGFGALVLAFFAGALISVGVVAFIAVWPQIRGRIVQSLRRVRSGGHGTAAVLIPLWRQGLSHVKRGVLHARGASVGTLASTRRRASALTHTAIESGHRGRRELVRATRSTAIRIAPPSRRIDPQREALRLNAAGTQHRRSGLYDEAVECHRRALELLRLLDDRRAVALTQSNLALALSHAGDDEWAIGLFEEAAATLRELGDEEHEAQIMANLGLAHRRHGRREEGDNVLELALSKLSPASSAYSTIEAELRRAS